MNIQLITIKNGQTIMAEVDSMEDKLMIIKQPVIVVSQQTKEGPMMAFAPFLDYSNEFKSGIRLALSDVLCMTTPVVELENQYSKMFGSGIMLASTNLKL